MKFIGSVTALIFLCFLAVGCGPNISPNTYNYPSIGPAANAISGVIVSARPVQVNGTNNGVGAIAGGVAGAAAGSAIGEGARSAIIGGVGGALLGGLAGNYIQNRLSTQTAVEYIIRDNHGKLLSVVQGPSGLGIGQHVIVILGNPARVIPATQ